MKKGLVFLLIVVGVNCFGARTMSSPTTMTRTTAFDDKACSIVSETAVSLTNLSSIDQNVSVTLINESLHVVAVNFLGSLFGLRGDWTGPTFGDSRLVSLHKDLSDRTDNTQTLLLRSKDSVGTLGRGTSCDQPSCVLYFHSNCKMEVDRVTCGYGNNSVGQDRDQWIAFMYRTGVKIGVEEDRGAIVANFSITTVAGCARNQTPLTESFALNGGRPF